MKKRIVLIGPVYPYKTGLSYYVTLLYKQLKLHHEVSIVSYSMQYPWILYRKPQKDYEDKTLIVGEAEFILNSANPINWIKTAKHIRKQQPDFIILQWLHPYFAPCYYTLAKLLHGIDILCICHNVYPHERFPFDKQLTKLALRQVDFFITHSKSDTNDLKRIVRNKRIKTAVHPAYDFFKLQNMTRSQARNQMNLRVQDKVILFFGLVRRYKGLRYLLEAVGLIKDLEDVKLLIAGDFCGNKEEYEKVIEKNGIQDRVQITDRHLQTFEVEKYFAACDLVVLPYESATQSGVVQVAYSMNRPVLATAVGGLPDVVIDMVTGYLVAPRSPKQIADAVVDYYENNREEQFSNGIQRMRHKYSWERMEETILDMIG